MYILHIYVYIHALIFIKRNIEKMDQDESLSIFYKVLMSDHMWIVYIFKNKTESRRRGFRSKMAV